MTVRRWLPWLVLLAVAVVTLVVGAQRSSHPTLAERTLDLAGQVRCPVCGGQSAAQSQTPAALAIRNQIHQELAAGASSRAVLDGLSAEYGPGILEKPQTNGVTLLVWVLPALGAGFAAAALVLAFRRWRPRPGSAASSEDRALVEQALGGGGA